MRNLVTMAALLCSSIILYLTAGDALSSTVEGCERLPSSTVSIPLDFQCRNEGGCVARRPKNGKLVSRNFRKGDLLSPDDGWIIDPEDGWEKLPNPPPPKPLTDCHLCHD